MIGGCVAWAGTRVLAALLYGVTPTDPLTLLGATGLLVVVAIGACWIPARRAIRVDPISVIRTE